jgi:hypothetical protein
MALVNHLGRWRFASAWRYLEIRGDAEILADDDYSFADRLGAKYHANLRARD